MIAASLGAWAREIGEAYDDIALVVLFEGAPEAGGIPACLVMKDGAKVPWVAPGKGVDGFAYDSIPGERVRDRLVGDPRFARPGLRVYVNFCDSRPLMFRYDGGRERLATEDLLGCRYQVLYPAPGSIPPLDEFFYLWGDARGDDPDGIDGEREA